MQFGRNFSAASLGLDDPRQSDELAAWNLCCDGRLRSNQ
jgi:hypothetical protein